jgi:uncharacterized repeat protein (TIGR01451 family)
MNKRLSTFLAVLILFIALSMLVSAGPTFTGDAPHDFTAADVLFIPDPGGDDVGVPRQAPIGTISGWDIAGIYLDYDHLTDILYIGADCYGICSDADGDGDPSRTSDWLARHGGTDTPDMDNTESFVFLIDTNNDYVPGSGGDGYDVAVGIPGNADIYAAGVYNFVGDLVAPSFGFGEQLPNAVDLFVSPDINRPDLELSIADFSTVPGFDFTPGVTFTFQAYFFSGSFSDDGIGEDSLPGLFGAIPVTVAAAPSLGDYVWYDVNTDGIQDAGEPGIAGVTVNLYDGDDNFVATTATDASGYYIFDRLNAGNYYVEFVPPAGYVVSPRDAGTDDAMDSDADPRTGRAIVTTLDPGEHDPTWDAGMYQLASLGDFVWHDLDANGIQELGEPGMANIAVNLYDGLDNLLRNTTTDASGYYVFAGLCPGDYFVEFIAPGGYALSPQDQSHSDTRDSDAHPINGRTIVTILDPGEHDPTWDAGLYQLASLGDFVWHDLNTDGVQDTGEPGLENVTVNLYDGAGVLAGSTTTDANGYYVFTDLTPGDYFVKFIAPTNYTFSPQDWGRDDTCDSDAHPINGQTMITTLDPGEHDPTWDAGLYQLASLGDFVWHDLDTDGVQELGEPGVERVTINLYDGAGNLLESTSTNASGYYVFANLYPGDYFVGFIAPDGYALSPQDQGSSDARDSDAHPISGRTIVTTLVPGEHDPTWDAGLYQLASLGDFVWHDLDTDGLQDAGEPGVEHVTVNLYDGDDNFVATTVTNDDGYYTFTNLESGDYYVEFIAPANYVLSLQDQSDDNALDSDAHPITGQTAVTILDPGEHDPTWDAGLYQLASLGDHVWHDLDANGIQETNEPGIANVTVNLYDDRGHSLGSTTTDASGDYAFTGLTPGDYVVEFIPPAGYVFSSQDQGADDALDSDASPSTGQTIVTTLDPGEHDPTWDAGLYQPASLGDFVWHDLNADGVQDAGEPGITNVTVSLYDDGGNPLRSTSTGDDGDYAFTDLTPGDYRVEFTPPNGYVFSPQDQGDDNARDSDADPITGQTVMTTLDSGEHDPTWDAGLYPTSPAVELVKTVNVTTITYGAPIVTYTIKVTNVGNITLNPVAVTDTLPDGVSYVPDSANPALSSVNGQLLTWADITAGAGLLPGQSAQITFQALVTTTPGVYVNVAFCEATYPEGVLTDDDEAALTVHEPEVALDKKIAAPGIVDGTITFIISIANIGSSTIDVLPLWDYFTSDLSYIGGSPPADSVDNVAGVVQWDDLTTCFGNMAPGEVFTLTTVFEIMADPRNFSAKNKAVVSDASDVFDNPANEVEDTVIVIQEPTAVDLLYFEASRQDDEVHLNWATALETDNFGFRILRSITGQLADSIEIGFIPGREHGSANGTHYIFSDKDAATNQGYAYWLIDVSFSGQETVHGPATVEGKAHHTIFLPLILRQSSTPPQGAMASPELDAAQRTNSTWDSFSRAIQRLVTRTRLPTSDRNDATRDVPKVARAQRR